MTVSAAQLRALSKLSLDLGKIVVAASVIGFFVPGFSGDVSVTGMALGVFASAFLFAIGIRIAA